MARRRRRVGGVAVSLAAAVSPWWHARASVSGHCDSSSGEHRFAFDHGCSAQLSAYSARVELAGTVAQVMVNETFTNEAQYPIEDASLALSVPGGATLLGFWAEITGSDDQALHGEVRMRQGFPSCPRTSWGGVSDSAGAGNPGTLRITLGRIPASASLNVRLEYVQEMKATLKPRHGSVMKLNLQLPSGARKKSSPRPGQERAAPLAVDVAVAAPKSNAASCSSDSSDEICRASSSAAPRLVELASPSHGTALRAVAAGADHAAAATLRSEVLQDVVLEIAIPTATTADPELFLEQHPTLGTSVAALWLPPSIMAASHSNLEVVLILDRSPSMLGTRLDRVRQAAKTFVRSVPVGACLNILGFGDGEGPLFKEASQKLSTATFQAASDHIATAFDSRASERGVPGAQGALTAVLQDLKRDEATQLRIFFVTDRHVPDGDACLRDIAAHCAPGTCQVSTLGLGWGASPQFVENAARAGRGTARFVAERGGVEPLERTLITQLAEALQPAVKDVDVAWADALAVESSDGVVSLLNRHPNQDNEALESDLQRFDRQGGVRELLTVPLDLPAVAAGDRLLAAAFLGRVSEDVLSQQSVMVHATIGGVRTSSKAKVSHVRRGSSLHALCASRLVEALEQGGADGRVELAGAEDRDWQVQALGLIYQQTTAHTQWLALAGADSNRVVVGGQALMLERSDSIHCAGPRGMSATKSFSGYSSGRPGGSFNQNWDLDPSAGLGRSQAQAPGAELSVRRPGGSGRAASLSIQTFGRLMPRLSTLDFTEIGSSVALRRLSAAGNSPLGPDLYGGDYGRYRDPWSQSYYGSGMAIKSFDRLGDKDMPKQAKPEESLSLRSLQKCGSRLSVLSTSRLSEQFSAVDFTQLGSSLALRKLHQPPGMSPYRFSMLSMLDYSCMSSSLSLAGWGLGRRSMSVQGASRFADYLGYGPDGFPGDLPELRSAEPSSLSLRSFPRMGKSLAVLDSAEGAASSRQARLASELVNAGAADVASMGSALSLRPLGRAVPGKGTGRRGQPPDLEHLASSLSLRRLSTGHHPLGYGDLGAAYGGINDLVTGSVEAAATAGLAETRKKSSEGPFSSEVSPPWDDYPPRYSSLGYPSTRQVGRLGSKLAINGDTKSVGSSSAGAARGDQQTRPDAWVGIGTVGGLVVPVLAIRRSGSTCQPSSEEVRIEWPTSADAARRLAPAAVYAASGPSVDEGAVRLSELAAPTEGTNQANVALQLSQSCVVTARRIAEGASKPQGEAALFEVSLAKTTFPAGATATGEVLAAALKRKQSALSDMNADPVVVEGSSSSTGSSARSVDYHTLIDLQLFDGPFDFSKMSTDAMAGMGLDQTLLKLLVAAYSIGTGSGNGALIAHTATALALLRVRHMAAEDAWALVAAKAEAWLAAAGSEGDTQAELAPPRCLGEPELCIAAADLVVVQWAKSPPRSSR